MFSFLVITSRTISLVDMGDSRVDSVYVTNVSCSVRRFVVLVLSLFLLVGWSCDLELGGSHEGTAFRRACNSDVRCTVKFGVSAGGAFLSPRSATAHYRLFPSVEVTCGGFIRGKYGWDQQVLPIGILCINANTSDILLQIC